MQKKLQFSSGFRADFRKIKLNHRASIHTKKPIGKFNLIPVKFTGNTLNLPSLYKFSYYLYSIYGLHIKFTEVRLNIKVLRRLLLTFKQTSVNLMSCP